MRSPVLLLDWRRLAHSMNPPFATYLPLSGNAIFFSDNVNNPGNRKVGSKIHYRRATIFIRIFENVGSGSEGQEGN